MHLDEEQVQRFLHGELAPPTAASAREHLGTCPACRARVAEAEREETRLFGLLQQLDHLPPRVDARALAVVGAARGRPRWARWAAGIVLVLGAAGAAYAAPGSPLRSLVQRLTAWGAGAPDPSPPPRPPAVPRGADSVPAEGTVQGIAVAPGERLTIAFSAEQAAVAAVTLTDGAEVVARAVGGAATFTSDEDRLLIDNAGSAARFEIQVPRAAPRVEIQVAGRRVFAKGPAGVRAEGRRDADGRYLVPLSGGRQ